MNLPGWWPTCGMTFARSKEDIKAGIYYRCEEPWIHYWIHGQSKKHKGNLRVTPYGLRKAE
jgi:hypothetical protein